MATVMRVRSHQTDLIFAKRGNKEGEKNHNVMGPGFCDQSKLLLALFISTSAWFSRWMGIKETVG